LAVQHSLWSTRIDETGDCFRGIWIAHMGNVSVKDDQSPFCSTAGHLFVPTADTAG
jgi:hypothetical protein